jgi:hypothetical protein
MPATRTLITVRPPEASGDDLFAVGRIAAWMNRGQDPGIDFLAAWLGNPDYRLRLGDADLARELTLRMLRQPQDGSASPSAAEPSGRLEQALRRFSAGLLGKLAFVEDKQATLQRQHDELQGGQQQLLARAQSLETALQARQREFAQALEVSQARTRELEQTIELMKRSRFWKARDLFFACKRALRIGR